MSLFKEFWKGMLGEALTEKEIAKVRDEINRLQKKGWPSVKIIASLQKFNGKLSEKYRAEAAYWTEVKREDTKKIGEIGKELGLEKYKVVLSPSACKICRQKTAGGRKIFKNQDIEKSGYGHVPPFHPSCYCILIPYS